MQAYHFWAVQGWEALCCHKLKTKEYEKDFAMLFAFVSVVTMGQEVKMETVVTDLVTTDTVRADTYVNQEGKFY